MDKKVDWSQVWQTKMAASVRATGGSDCARAWDDKASARNYWKMVLEAGETIDEIIRGLPVESGSRILDVGAGPGTLAIPLAEKAAHITAVEPAGSMAEILLENIAAYGRDNVVCVNKRWEEVDEKKDLFPPYDLVVASFSLGMPDIRTAVEKMLRVTKGYVFLLWFAGPTSWDYDSQYIFKALFNTPYPPMPKGDVIFNVLYQMGIYPNIEVFPSRMNHLYASVDAMVEEFRLKMPGLTEEQAQTLGEYYEKKVEKRNGAVIFPYTWQTMKLWWKKS